MSWLVSRLRERFDIILIDGPAIADAAVTIPHADGVYVVLPHGESLSNASAQAVTRMGGTLSGLIQTNFGT